MMEISQYTQTPDNLFALLSKYRVTVPGIQRHYVQGADNAKAKEVREGFVKSLLEGKEMQLHFVYGPINYDDEDAFIPVDGQQRLTTLWLLARYAVERLGDENQRKDLLKLLSRFSYADRMHATRFCQALCSETWNVGNDPEQDIPRQNWFWNYWQQDETVASMLRMLSTIHSEWAAKQNVEPNDVLDSLVNKIKFSLRMDAFGDDIYMKMNARGLQLTQWENFKAKFADRLSTENANKELIKKYFVQEGNDKSVKKIWNEKIEEFSNRYFDVASKQEEEQVDLASNHTKLVEKLPDDAFFALMGRVCYYLGYGDADNGGNEIKRENLSALASFKGNLPYVPFDEFADVFFESYKSKGDNTSRKERNIDEFALQYLVMLDMILNKAKSEKEYLNSPYWDKKSIIGTFFDPQNENERDFSLCCFEYVKVYPQATYEDFRRAYRHMWNILENVNRGDDKKCYDRVKWIAYYSAHVQSAKLYPTNIDTIDELKELLAESKCFDKQKDVEQILEEFIKAKQILDENGNLRKYVGSCRKKDNSEYSSWEEILMDAESHAFFKGAIRFLFRDENGEINEKSWKYFDSKWKNARKYFDKEGVKDKNIDVVISFIKKIRSGKLCNYSYSFQKTTWKKILLGNRDFELETNHLFLMNDDKNDNDNSSQLRKDLLHKDWLSARLNARTCWWFIKKWSGNQSVFTDYERTSGTNADRIWSIGNHRNQLLDSLKEFIAIQNADKYGFYKGLHIDFQYEFNNETYDFRFYGDNYVYLMNQDPKNPNGYTYRDQNAKEELDIYCCFKAEGIDDSDEFIKQLNDLIKEHENRCSQCTDQICEQPAEQ